MNKHSLKTNMTILLLIPVVGLLIVAGNSAFQKYEAVQEMEMIGNLSNLSVKISAMVHELQKERGLTAGFLGSEGKKFSRELGNQKPLTDSAVAEFSEFLSALDVSKYGSSLKRNIESGRSKLNDLSKIRSRISGMDIKTQEAIGFYTSTNITFLDAIATMSHESGNGEIVGQLTAYVNFLKSKEQAGIERAVLTGVFTRDSFGPGELEKFVTIITRQATYTSVFESTASENNIKFHNRTITGGDVDAVNSMRQVALDNASVGGFQISPETWFKQQTGKINLLKEVEDHLSEDLKQNAKTIKGKAFKSLLLALGLMALLTTITGLVGYFSIRGIVNRVTENIDKLSQTASEVSLAGQQVSSSSESIASGASEQASSLEEISASLEEMASMTKNNVENAQEMSESSLTAAKSARDGLETMVRMNEAIERIKTSSSQMNKTLITIDAIASQTNLLALNAAVEAARAGDAGRGFAVVAEEVRNLAMRCSSASGDISGLVTEAAESAEIGSSICENVNTNLAELTGAVENVSKLAGEVSTASKEQSLGISQLNEGVSQLDMVTQANAAAAEESAASSSELHRQAGHMSSIVAEITNIIVGSTKPVSPGTGRSRNPGIGSTRTINPGKASVDRVVELENRDFEDLNSVLDLGAEEKITIEL